MEKEAAVELNPYSVESRPDTGMYNARLGIWLFLASEVMLFGAFFSSYILLRAGFPDWPRESTVMNIPIGSVNTLILITSSMTMIMSWVSLRLKQFTRFRRFLAWTIGLGGLFLVLKFIEYAGHFHDWRGIGLPRSVSGIFEAGDIADVEAALAPRPLLLAGMLDGLDRLVPQRELERQLQPVTQAYRNSPSGALLIQTNTHLPDLSNWFLKHWHQER